MQGKRIYASKCVTLHPNFFFRFVFPSFIFITDFVIFDKNKAFRRLTQSFFHSIIVYESGELKILTLGPPPSRLPLVRWRHSQPKICHFAEQAQGFLLKVN